MNEHEYESINYYYQAKTNVTKYLIKLVIAVFNFSPDSAANIYKNE